MYPNYLAKFPTPQTINIEIWGLKRQQVNFESLSSEPGSGVRVGKKTNYKEDTFFVHVAESGKLCLVQKWREQPRGPSMTRSWPYALLLGSLQGCTGRCVSHDRCLVVTHILSGPSALHTADCWVCWFVFFSPDETIYTSYYNPYELC